jgi:hypothetical protein
VVNNLHFTPAAMSAAAARSSYAINSRHLANSKRQNIDALAHVYLQEVKSQLFSILLITSRVLKYQRWEKT